MDSKESVRAFIGIDLQDKIKEKLCTSLEELPNEGISQVSKDNMHVTLFFLGNLDSGKLEKVKKVLMSLDYRKFKLAVNGVGTFSIRSPSVLFAEISEGRDNIIEIYKLLFDNLKGIGFKMDERAYTPHITIARLKGQNGKKPVLEFIKSHEKDDYGSFVCGSVRLKSSLLTPLGPVYTNLAEVMLK